MSQLHPKRSLQIAAVIALACGLIVAPGTAASAHEALASANPADGETVSQLAAVELVFSAEITAEPVTSRTTQVIGPDGRHYETDCSAVAGAFMTTPVALGAAGDYRVLWRAVSADGHPISGEYTFSYAPTADASVSPGMDQPACDENGQRVIQETPKPVATIEASELPQAEPTGSASPTPVSVGAERGADVWPWVAATAGGIAVIAVIAWVLRARRKTE
jgi:methionine-rich copper-binding protein CopC